MYKWILILAVTGAHAADERSLALSLRARTDFERVEASPFPDLRETIRCVQTQAEALPLAAPTDVPVIRYRQGYCGMLSATVTGNRAEYEEAGRNLSKAMAAWSARAPEPMSSGLQVLSEIARLKAGTAPEAIPDIQAGLTDAIQRATCPSNVMPQWDCTQLLQAGRLWLGWIADRKGELPDAVRQFRALPESGWNPWVAGRQEFANGHYGEAVEQFQKAVQAWQDERKYPKPGIPRILGPQPDLPDAIYQLGAAQYLAKQYPAASATMDAALKARPENAHALFVRGLAKEALGNTEAAQADYQMASRSAFANPDQPNASARAHYYRGVWMFRRKEFTRAEDEFATALNQDPGADLRPDVAAWRHMAAVAAGGCGASAQKLEDAMRTASGFFPRGGAGKLLEGCRSEPANVTRK